MNEVEKAVAGVALTYSKHHEELFEIINTSDYFEDATCRAVIDTCLKIRSEGFTPDLLNVAEASKLPAATLADISRVGIFDWQRAAYIIREKWMHRKFKELCHSGLQSEYEDVFQHLNSYSDGIEKILSSTDSLKTRSILDMTAEATEQVQLISQDSNALTGADTGIERLNQRTRGWQKSDLIIVAARPGMGKTAFALTSSRHAQRQGKVLFFSIEMSGVQLTKRLISAVGHLTMSEIFKDGIQEPDRWAEYGRAADLVSSMNLEIYDQINYMEDIANKVAVMCRRYDVRLVIIDYLQICATREKTQGEENRISKMSWKAKQIAKRNDVPVMLLSQLSRKVEDRPNKKPQLADLRHSGAIEQDADLILFPWRSQQYEMTDERGEYYALIDIAKYRNGDPSLVDNVEMDGEHQTWKQVQSVHF